MCFMNTPELSQSQMNRVSAYYQLVVKSICDTFGKEYSGISYIYRNISYPVLQVTFHSFRNIQYNSLNLEVFYLTTRVLDTTNLVLSIKHGEYFLQS